MDDLIAALTQARYISLTTFRRDGRAVSTPVWFALDGTKILVWTDAASGKAKRVRANGRATIAPSDARGKPRRAAWDAHARQLPGADFPRANRILTTKYRWQKPLVGLWTSFTVVALRKPRPTEVYLELQFADPAG